MPRAPAETEKFLRHTGARIPLIGGAMYPCSNPELVAAVSEAGGIGIIQPLTLSVVCGYPFLKGLEKIRSLTTRPVGINVIVEKSVRAYEKRAESWVEDGLAAGVRFFVTALGNPKWVVDRVHAAGGFVYHDVTERKWAELAIKAGVDGLICVNSEAGGHAGERTPEKLITEFRGFGVPLVAAGGVGCAESFRGKLDLGYAAVQIGTRLIATPECHAPQDYKDAIVAARADSIVRTERITGVPLAVIRTPLVERMGLKVGPIARLLFKGRKTRHWIRSWYSIRSVWNFRRAMKSPQSTRDVYQAGKSVEGIEAIEPVAQILAAWERAL